MWLYTFYWGFNLSDLPNCHQNHRFREIPISLSLWFRNCRSMCISRSKIINFSPIFFMPSTETVSIHENSIFKGKYCWCDRWYWSKHTQRTHNQNNDEICINMCPSENVFTYHKDFLLRPMYNNESVEDSLPKKFVQAFLDFLPTFREICRNPSRTHNCPPKKSSLTQCHSLSVTHSN